MVRSAPEWFLTGMEECSTEYAAASSANGLGFSPAGAESLDAYGSVPNTRYGGRLPAQCGAYVRPFAWAYYAKGVSNKLWKQAKGLDPPYSIIGIGSDLRNWMPDTGASSHFTPCLLDLKEVEEGLDLGDEVADGHIVKCTARGVVEINMIADDGLPFKANLQGVIYVPGLKRCLFSVTAFASRGHYAIVSKNEIQLMFGQ